MRLELGDRGGEHAGNRCATSSVWQATKRGVVVDAVAPKQGISHAGRPAGAAMKVIALNKHFVTDEVMRVGKSVDPRWRDDSAGFTQPGSDMMTRIRDLGDERIRLMDESGADVQVLSLTAPGVQNLDATDARDAASCVNDLIASTVAGRPDRFQGFATLPTPDPAAAARGLERAVEQLGLEGAMIFGRTRDRSPSSSARYLRQRPPRTKAFVVSDRFLVTTMIGTASTSQRSTSLV